MIDLDVTMADTNADVLSVESLAKLVRSGLSAGADATVRGRMTPSVAKVFFEDLLRYGPVRLNIQVHAFDVN